MLQQQFACRDFEAGTPALRERYMAFYDPALDQLNNSNFSGKNVIELTFSK